MMAPRKEDKKAVKQSPGKKKKSPLKQTQAKKIQKSKKAATPGKKVKLKLKLNASQSPTKKKDKTPKEKKSPKKTSPKTAKLKAKDEKKKKKEENKKTPELSKKGKKSKPNMKLLEFSALRVSPLRIIKQNTNSQLKVVKKTPPSSLPLEHKKSIAKKSVGKKNAEKKSVERKSTGKQASSSPLKSIKEKSLLLPQNESLKSVKEIIDPPNAKIATFSSKAPVVQSTKTPINLKVTCFTCNLTVTKDSFKSHLFFGHLKCDNCSLKITKCKDFVELQNILSLVDDMDVVDNDKFACEKSPSGIHSPLMWDSCISFLQYNIEKDLTISNFLNKLNVPLTGEKINMELFNYLEKLKVLSNCEPWSLVYEICKKQFGKLLSLDPDTTNNESEDNINRDQKIEKLVPNRNSLQIQSVNKDSLTYKHQTCEKVKQSETQTQPLTETKETSEQKTSLKALKLVRLNKFRKLNLRATNKSPPKTNHVRKESKSPSGSESSENNNESPKGNRIALNATPKDRSSSREDKIPLKSNPKEVGTTPRNAIPSRSDVVTPKGVAATPLDDRTSQTRSDEVSLKEEDKSFEIEDMRICESEENPEIMLSQTYNLQKLEEIVEYVSLGESAASSSPTNTKITPPESRQEVHGPLENRYKTQKKRKTKVKVKRLGRLPPLPLPTNGRYLIIQYPKQKCPEECPECYSGFVPSNLSMNCTTFVTTVRCEECGIVVFIVPVIIKN